jgi:hypothetical protein
MNFNDEKIMWFMTQIIYSNKMSAVWQTYYFNHGREVFNFTQRFVSTVARLHNYKTYIHLEEKKYNKLGECMRDVIVLCIIVVFKHPTVYLDVDQKCITRLNIPIPR